MNLNFLVGGSPSQLSSDTNLDPLATDGIQGPKTRAAAAIYQARHNEIHAGSDVAHLRPTGRVDAATRDALRSEVQSIQQQLIDLGYDLGRWGADGIAGRCTQAALRQFQEDNGLPATGRLDLSTELALISRSALECYPEPTQQAPGLPPEIENQSPLEGTDIDDLESPVRTIEGVDDPHMHQRLLGEQPDTLVA